jgi:Flp pilus assembly protein TadG
MRQERGQAMVEFAIVLPVLILIILGILYFGRYENYSNQETQLAEQAVRWAAVNVNPAAAGSGTTLQAAVQKQAAPELQAGSTDVTTAAQVFIYYPTTGAIGPPGAIGTPVRACVTATVQLPFLNTSAQIMQSAEMRVEDLRTNPPSPAGASGWTPDTATSSPPVPSSCPTS